MTEHDTAPVLVTGASGYIGGHLVPALLQRGRRVRVFTRAPARLRSRPWADQVEFVEGDATDPDAVGRALAGVDIAYYLLHSMDGEGDFVTRDRRLALGFADAAAQARPRRLVYLSGLHPEGPLSAHLASRVEVGRILLGSGVPTVVLQAGVVLGAGSASFDMLRHLTERLPAMVAPRWLSNRIQPIAIDDVVHYLAAAADLPGHPNRTFDIGGPDVLTYRQMIEGYARLTGLGRRHIVTVPVLTPKLASGWVGLVTPVPAGIARPLVGSLVHEAVVKEDDILALTGPPPGGRTGFADAVARATAEIDPQRWRRTIIAVGALTAGCAVLGSILTDPGSAWYRGLRKPAWQPPPTAFPLVWTTLFTGIAVAATATVAELEKEGEDAAAAAFKAAYLANLALNAAWSGVFFRAHATRAATVVAALLAASGADLARRAAPTGRGKAAVLGGYAAWCAFATALTRAVAVRNRHASGRS